MISLKKRTGGRTATKTQGESQSVNVSTTQPQCERIAESNAAYAPCDTFNADETGAFWQMIPGRWLMQIKKSEEAKEWNKLRARISLMVKCDARGSEQLPLLFIGKSKSPAAFKRKSADHDGLWYQQQVKTCLLFPRLERWMDKINNQMQREKRQIILCVQNCRGHKSVRT